MSAYFEKHGKAGYLSPSYMEPFGSNAVKWPTTNTPATPPQIPSLVDLEEAADRKESQDFWKKDSSSAYKQP